MKISRITVVCKLFSLLCFVFLGVAPIPYVQTAILNLSNPYLRSSTILLNRNLKWQGFHHSNNPTFLNLLVFLKSCRHLNSHEQCMTLAHLAIMSHSYTNWRNSNAKLSCYLRVNYLLSDELLIMT